MAFRVGRSTSRTPFKHWVLDAELGRLCGIFANPKAKGKVPAIANPFLVVDLCAGDGETGLGQDSSPSIIDHHLEIAYRQGVSVLGVLIERQAGTYETLRKNIPQQPYLEFRNEDARNYAPQCKPRQAVFLHSDPNNIQGWPISDNLINGLSETTTLLATLGCNVGGLKRMKLEDRQQWFEHVRKCIEGMPSYHDAVLIALDGDTDQWAYLLRLPKKWSMDTCGNIADKGRAYTEFGLSLASYRDSRDAFEALQDRLFLTAKERKRRR